MKILYIISKYITFPGAFLRCFWEQFVCKIQKVAIENNKCLQVNEMCGHIEHETIDGKVKSFLNALIPGLLVFIAGAVLLTAPFVNLLLIGILQKPLKVIMYVMLYLALSMLTNIFPSNIYVGKLQTAWQRFENPFCPGSCDNVCWLLFGKILRDVFC